MKIVRNGFRKRRAEHRDRRRKDQARTIPVADGTNGFEQCARAVEIDPHAFLEINLGLAGDDAGEMKDHVGAACDCSTRRFFIGNIGGGGLDLAGESKRLLRRDDVDQGEPLDRLAVERACRRPGAR